MAAPINKDAGSLLQGSRVYLSGPMDFVASRELEMKFGWRNRVGEFLRKAGVTVFDPWNKPGVRGLHDQEAYGREGTETQEIRSQWTFEPSEAGSSTRAAITGKFWETLHIDLRMVDVSDFVVAYCPTNIYSVGTPHEIALCRQQRKPVLFVSPPVVFPALNELRKHLAKDEKGTSLLTDLEKQIPIKPNERGIPSLWYTTLVGGEGFFDGFGFTAYSSEFGWELSDLDKFELHYSPKRPLLPFLESLKTKLPQKWNSRVSKFVRNDDWLLWDLPLGGAKVEEPQEKPLSIPAD